MSEQPQRITQNDTVYIRDDLYRIASEVFGFRPDVAALEIRKKDKRIAELEAAIHDAINLCPWVPERLTQVVKENSDERSS